VHLHSDFELLYGGDHWCSWGKADLAMNKHHASKLELLNLKSEASARKDDFKGLRECLLKKRLLCSPHPQKSRNLASEWRVDDGF
jgi:hypothetical protein